MNIVKRLEANVSAHTPLLNIVAHVERGSSLTGNPTGEERNSSEVRRDPSFPSGWDYEARFKRCFQWNHQHKIRTWRYDGAVVAMHDSGEEPDVEISRSGVNRFCSAESAPLASLFRGIVSVLVNAQLQIYCLPSQRL